MPEVVGFRASGWDTPLWISRNRTAGRFNDPTRGHITQYWGLHPLTPWAEIIRGHSMSRTSYLTGVRNRIWAARFFLDENEMTRVDFDNASSFGLRPEDLVSDDYGPCQAFADRCRDAGRNVLVVPSAALPGTRNLVLFGPVVKTPFHAPPRIGLVPASVAAEQGTNPTHLEDFICFRGEANPELDAWKHSRAFEFVDPKVAPFPF